MSSVYECDHKKAGNGCPLAQLLQEQVFIRLAHALGPHCRDSYAARGGRFNFNEGRFLTSVPTSTACESCQYRQPHTGGNGERFFR